MATQRQPKWFRCLVGNSAREHLAATHSSPDSFGLMLAASGGPRWLGLVGIDRVLGRFLSQRTSTSRLPLLGASSGAWRMAALCADSQGETYEDLIHEYIEQKFESKATPQQVSRVCRGYLSRLFTQDRICHGLDHPRWQLNFTTALMQGEFPDYYAVLRSISRAVTWNGLGRKHLGRVYRRALFSTLPHPESSPLRGGWDDIPTVQVPLDERNFRQGLMATGSIPLVLEGESAVPCSPPGHHLDGGLLDYHFEVPNSQTPVLYPHFSSQPVPGWLDRFPPYRKIGTKAKEWLCLVLPSDEMVSRFGLGEFPNRHHFKKLSDHERQRFWRQTARESEKMEAELTMCLESGGLLEIAEPLG